MTTIILCLLFGLFCYLLGDMMGYQRGHSDGEEFGESIGKLDQHIYEENVRRKRRYK